MKDVGCICEVLKEEETIKSVDFSGNAFGVDGGSEIAEALKCEYSHLLAYNACAYIV